MNFFSLFKILTFSILLTCHFDSKDGCRSDFKAINLRDFSLYSSLSNIKKTLPNKLTEINKGLTKYNSYTFTENVKIENKKIKVIYYFDFYNQKLSIFHFDIFSDRIFFNKVVNILKNNNTKLVTPEGKIRLSYSYNDKKCHQFLYLLFRNGKLCTSGGIAILD